MATAKTGIGNFLGGFAQAFQQGQQIQAQIRSRREELKIRKQLADSELKVNDAKVAELTRKARAGAQFDELLAAAGEMFGLPARPATIGMSPAEPTPAPGAAGGLPPIGTEAPDTAPTFQATEAPRPVSAAPQGPMPGPAAAMNVFGGVPMLPPRSRAALQLIGASVLAQQGDFGKATELLLGAFPDPAQARDTFSRAAFARFNRLPQTPDEFVQTFRDVAMLGGQEEAARVTGRNVAEQGSGTVPLPPDVRAELATEPGTNVFRPTPEQTGRALARAKAQQVRVSAAQGAAGVTAKAEAAQDLPIGPEGAANLLNPTTLASPPPNLTRREAIRAGFVAVSPKQREDLADVQNANVIVETIKNLADRLITAESGADAAKQGIALSGQSATRTGPQATLARTYEDTRQQFTGILSRQFGGQRGVLTDRDLDRVEKGFPSFFDTRAIKDAKLGIIQIISETAAEAKRRAILGLPPDPTFREKLTRLFNALDATGQARPPGAPGGRSSFSTEQEGRATIIASGVLAGRLDESQAAAALAELGMTPTDVQAFLGVIRQQQGVSRGRR